MVDKATAIIGFWVGGAAVLQQIASYLLKRDLRQVHVIVNSQRSEMIREIAYLKRRVATLMPWDEDAKNAAEKAEKLAREL